MKNSKWISRRFIWIGVAIFIAGGLLAGLINLEIGKSKCSAICKKQGASAGEVRQIGRGLSDGCRCLKNDGTEFKR